MEGQGTIVCKDGAKLSFTGGTNAQIAGGMFKTSGMPNVTIQDGAVLLMNMGGTLKVTETANVTFTNDKYPRSKNHEYKQLKTIVKKGASIGANATILPDITIGENSMVGAGSVVTKNVPANTIVCGNPAKEIKEV